MITSIHNLTTALMINNMHKNKDNNREEEKESISKFDYIMNLDDWTGHEEEYENEVIDYINSTSMSEEDIYEILNKVRNIHDIDFSPGVCERCYTVFAEGWICDNKPYCCEDCIKNVISEDSWISMQEYEPDENKRKIFWG